MTGQPDLTTIPVAEPLPFAVVPQWRSRMAERTRNGTFDFPAAIDPDAVTARIWADRLALVDKSAGLRDPLADFLPAATEAPECLASVCRQEIAATRRLRQERPGLIRSLGDDFFATLIAARRASGFSDIAARRTSARTSGSSGEASTLYPDPGQIPALLAKASRAIVMLGQHDAALSATIAYCAAVHCHVFRDGNKRTARVLWAALAASDGRDALPLALLSNLNRQAFLIQSRRVILLGNWEPMLAYLTAAAEACHNWMRAHLM